MAPATKDLLKLVVADCDKAIQSQIIGDIASVSLTYVHSTRLDYRLDSPVYVQVVVDGNHPATGDAVSLTLLNYTCPVSSSTAARIPVMEELAKALAGRLQVPLVTALKFNPLKTGRSVYAHAFAR